LVPRKLIKCPSRSVDYVLSRPDPRVMTSDILLNRIGQGNLYDSGHGSCCRYLKKNTRRTNISRNSQKMQSRTPFEKALFHVFWVLEKFLRSNVDSQKKSVQTFCRPIGFFREQSTCAATECSSARNGANPLFFSQTVLRLRAYHCSPTFQQHINVCTALANCSGSSKTIL
jgi:hypothetical protein